MKTALKGAPAPKDEAAVITIEGQEVTIGRVVLNMIQPASIANREVDRAMRQVELDETINGFEILRGKAREELVKVPRSQIASFRLPDATPEMTPERSVQSREILSISSLVFEGTAKWRFNRQGRIIAARLDDAGFAERVRSGAETFGAGDRLDVDLIVHQKYDSATNDYLTKAYTIDHVWGHEKRQEQQSLFVE